MDSKEIAPEKFYGPPSLAQFKIEKAIKEQKPKVSNNLPKCLTGLFGPSHTWKMFRKQSDAINYAHKKRNGLMCFSCEQKNGERLFLTAHPVFFWYLYSKREQKDRNSYEIIQEFNVCKLYFDIEFDILCNPNHNGEVMLDNFLKIVNYNLKEKYNVHPDSNDILDLDSTSSTKFSHHIIYQIKDTAFQDNYVVGSFVKGICFELKYGNSSGKLKELAEKYHLSEEDLHQLFVKDKKNMESLFCDEGVYTKNRHFRLLGSTKCHKNSPLVLSEHNKYIPTVSKYNDLELQMFLDSLITYFENEINHIISDKHDVKLEKQVKSTRNTSEVSDVNANDTNYSDIDIFIHSLISPNGKIRRKINFNSSNVIVYEILGFRYCYNIGREHKSNNIKLIVDLNNLTYYQKCYDPECSNYRSHDISLPDKIVFLYTDDSDFNFSCDDNENFDCMDLTDDELLAILNEVEASVLVADTYDL